MKQVVLWLIVASVILAVVRMIWPLIVIGVAVWLVVRAARTREDGRRALLARCELQHAQVMRGDPRGTYGLYPAADLGPLSAHWPIPAPIISEK